ncbi:MAG TPA: hypothetical protein DDZ55_03930, partial [Firmicutes bacterium]|nr:hypothetical protein [Bacillota bacterium]
NCCYRNIYLKVSPIFFRNITIGPGTKEDPATVTSVLTIGANQRYADRGSAGRLSHQDHRSKPLYGTPGLGDDEDGNLDVGALFQSPPGSGVLVDLGVAYEKDRLHAGLALKNIGALTWRKICQETFSYEGAVDTGPDGAEFSEGEPVTDETVLYNYTMSIPIVLQIQGSYQVFKNVYWHLGMETGFGDGWGISSSPCFQTGMEWRPQHLVRLAGDLAYHNRHLNYQALCELRLFCLWTCFQVGWIHDLGGLNGSAMLALHF